MFGDVAQLGEHCLCKAGVEGSIPFVSTIKDGKLGKMLGHLALFCRFFRKVFAAPLSAAKGFVYWTKTKS